MVTSNSQLLADTHVSHRLVTLNLTLNPNSQLLADTHASHRLVTLIFSSWLIHSSAIAWLPQIFSYWLIRMSAIA